MTPELAEIRDFLAQHAPFDALPAETLTGLPATLESTYVRRGRVIKDVGQDNDELFVVRSGAVDVHDEHGRLLDRRGAGEGFGMSSLVLGGPLSHRFTAMEDSLLLVLPGEEFRRLAEDHPSFRLHYVEHEGARLAEAVRTVRTSRHGTAILTRRVRDLVGREPVTIRPDDSIREAAALMRTERVSSLLVQVEGRLVGILTDRDLRDRVVAEAYDVSSPVEAVMTPDPWTATPDALAFEVMLAMVGRGIHHVPVRDGDRVLGVVTTTDLARQQRSDPVLLVGDIAKRPDVAGLVEAARLVPRVVEDLVDADATADDIGRMVSAIGDAVERRLLTLTELDLGPAPAPWAWLALGSRARREQGLASDQDHALVLGRSVEGEDAAWFATFAERVRDGLEACGYRRCAGDVMSSNPRWRQPVAAWQDDFTRWTDAPGREAILHSSIFFDLRAVQGEASLVDQVADHLHARARGSSLFLAHTAGLAASQPVPLGFFRGLVLEKEGEHRDRLDLKRGAMTIVTIARLHALAAGLTPVNTRERLAAAAAAGTISTGLADDLRDAHELISYVRLRHHARQVREGGRPDNWLSPDELSGFERRTLRDAFAVVRTAQRAVAQRYPVHAVS